MDNARITKEAWQCSGTIPCRAMSGELANALQKP